MNHNFRRAKQLRYVLWGGYLILFLTPLFLMTYDLSIPGLYYDEAIQAVPAMDFLKNNGQSWDYPGKKSIEILKRPFPFMTQPYMGALKSQALIPVFALFGPSKGSLRIATITIALIGLLAAMVWAYKTFGLSIALISGVFIVSDPCFLFISRHDWGSFSLGFLCRCCSLLFITNGWKKRSCWQFFAGGCFLGLGLYNKIDFSVFIIAAGMALAISSLKSIFAGLRIRFKEITCGIAGFILCTLPLFLSIEWVELNRCIASISESSGGYFSEWGEKLHTTVAMLNGSYFHRLMLSGGVFESMFNIKGAAYSPFLIIFVCSMIILGTVLLVNKKKGNMNPNNTFVFFITIFTMVGFFFLPNAVRIHHMMHVYPFPHLVVAITATQLFKAGGMIQKHFRRTVVASLVVLVLAGNLYVDARTLSTIRRTGGKGRWSEALNLFADELKHKPGAVVVSLDWGFHGQLAFENVPAMLIEPIWEFSSTTRRLTIPGTSRNIYLVYAPKYTLFPYHIAFAKAVLSLPSEFVTITKHYDRQDELVFISVSINRPHRIIYDKGKFEILTAKP